MDRNDLLRELELLPAWQLKTGAQVTVKAPDITLIADSENLNVEKISAVQQHLLPETTNAQTIHGVSKQKVAVLVYLHLPKTEHFYASEAGLLLDNMLKAIQLKRGSDVAIVFDSSELQTYEAKFYLALGEKAAGQLLANNAPLLELRGKLQKQADKQVIVSHELAHLLLQPLSKREAWQDLKLLKTALNHLQTNDLAPL